MRQWIGVAVAAVLAVGCGGSSGGGGGGNSPTTPDAPRLRDVSFSLSANVGLLQVCRAQGFESAWTAFGSYTGDFVGGTLVYTGTLQPRGTTANLSFPIPSPDVGIEGDSFEVRGCVSAGANDRLEVELWAISPAGVESNRARGTIPLR